MAISNLRSLHALRYWLKEAQYPQGDMSRILGIFMVGYHGNLDGLFLGIPLWPYKRWKSLLELARNGGHRVLQSMEP